MQKVKILSTIVIASALSGCVMAPLSSDYTARSNGAGNWSTNAGFMANAGTAYARQSYGIGENFNVGGVIETGNNNIIGVNAKYAFINQSEGPALALLGGFGGGRVHGSDAPGESRTTNGLYFDVGPIVSYRANHLEPYASVVFDYLHLSNHIKFKSGGVNFMNDDVRNNAKYGKLTAGTNVWFNNNLGLTLNANYLVGNGHSNPFFGIGFIAQY